MQPPSSRRLVLQPRSRFTETVSLNPRPRAQAQQRRLTGDATGRDDGISQECGLLAPLSAQLRCPCRGGALGGDQGSEWDPPLPSHPQAPQAAPQRGGPQVHNILSSTSSRKGSADPTRLNNLQI